VGKSSDDIHLGHLFPCLGDARFRGFPLGSLFQTDRFVIFHKKEEDGDEQSRQGDNPEGILPSPVGGDESAGHNPAAIPSGMDIFQSPTMKARLFSG